MDGKNNQGCDTSGQGCGRKIVRALQAGEMYHRCCRHLNSFKLSFATTGLIAANSHFKSFCSNQRQFVNLSAGTWGLIRIEASKGFTGPN